MLLHMIHSVERSKSSTKRHHGNRNTVFEYSGNSGSRFQIVHRIIRESEILLYFVPFTALSDSSMNSDPRIGQNTRLTEYWRH